MKLLDVFRAYPGGLEALESATEVKVRTLYRIAQGAHETVPGYYLTRIAQAFDRALRVPRPDRDWWRRQEPPVEPWRYQALMELWMDARLARSS
jgi:hypothetical protein